MLWEHITPLETLVQFSTLGKGCPPLDLARMCVCLMDWLVWQGLSMLL